MPNMIEIIDYLDSAGIKPSNSGFRYLISIIEEGSSQQYSLFRIANLYNFVADKYNSTPTRVERSIRYSLQGTQQTNKEFLSRAIYHFNTNSHREPDVISRYTSLSENTNSGVKTVNVKMKKTILFAENGR